MEFISSYYAVSLWYTRNTAVLKNYDMFQYLTPSSNCFSTVFLHLVSFLLVYTHTLYIYIYILIPGTAVVRGSISGRYNDGIFLFATAFRPALGPTHPPIQWVPEVKWSGREADHSPSPSAEVKNVWSCTSIPPIRVHDVVLNWAMHTYSRRDT
jgi:hypothetical protein